MAYCSVEQVQGEFKKLTLSDGTSLSSDAISEFIDEASAEIDMILGARFIVPVTDDAASLVLQRICRAMVADRVAGVLAVKTGDTKTEQDSSPKMTRKDSIAYLNDIASGKYALGLAALIQVSGSVDSYARRSGPLNRVFKRDVNQW